MHCSVLQVDKQLWLSLETKATEWAAVLLLIFGQQPVSHLHRCLSGNSFRTAAPRLSQAMAERALC